MTRSSGNPEVAAGQLASEAGHPPPTSTGDAMADTQEFARLGLEVDPSAAMSADSGFRVGWRGYDRGQVDRYRSRVETDLATTRIGYQRAIHAHERLSGLCCVDWKRRVRERWGGLGRCQRQAASSAKATRTRSWGGTSTVSS
jgi:hypothetical protein